MYKQIFKLISEEFSGNNAKEIINEIAKYHRIQSSPGFRAAAKFCHEKIRSYMIPFVKIHSYPALGGNTFWGTYVPKEWSIKDAKLDLIEPLEARKNLSNFLDDPCSIIQRSKATPNEGITAEVVILPRDLSEEEILKYDLKNKFVLTDEPDFNKLRFLVLNKIGAAGILYDFVSEIKPIRTKANFPTARRYTSFWFGSKEDEGNVRGFVLSAEQGAELRNLLANVEKENKAHKGKEKSIKKVKVHAQINSSFYDGHMEVVDFFIPGKEKGEEVLAVAHLCHPKPGAVDNASGCGTLIEVARILNNLITEGKLEQPKRGIRFLLMAEFTGTFCYLASNENKITNFIAGINLDMVGADQSFGGGRTLIIERTHNAKPSFVNDVISALLNEMSKEVSNFMQTGAFATFKFANDQPFTGGSDHEVLGFPDIGIGTPSINQWPDRYYHSGEDTIEKVSPEMLHKVGTLTATYCYFLANTDLPEMYWIANEVAMKGKERITNFSRNYLNEFVDKISEIINKSKEISDQKEKINELTKEQTASQFFEKIDSKFIFRKNIELQALQSLVQLSIKTNENKRFNDFVEELQKALEEHVEREITQIKFSFKKLIETMQIIPQAMPLKVKDEFDKLAEKIIPKKVFKGPITNLMLADLTYEDHKNYKEITKEYKEFGSTIESAPFWIDGKRTIAEIANLVENDLGKVNVPLLVKVFQYYKEHGLVQW